MKKAGHGVRYGAATFTKPLASAPFNQTSSLTEALSLHQAGRLTEAEAIYKRILAAQPKHFDGSHLLGVICLQTGRLDEALRYFDLAIKINPRDAGALNNRGVALQELQRLDEAMQSFERAIRIKPNYAEAHCNRGNVHKQSGRFEQALASYDRALSERRDYADAHSNRADALCELARFEEALTSADSALALRPQYAEAHANRANALHKLGRYEEALVSHDRAIALRPNHPTAHSNRGTTLYELFRFDEALASVDRALARAPNFAEAHNNRGNILQGLKRFEDSLLSYDRAVVLRPRFPDAYSNRGNALKELQRFADALADFDQAMALRPDFPDAHFNAALCLMLLGDFESGWRHYEWRWGIDQLKSERRNFTQPQWDGSDAIADKTILLHAEQGFGDTLQFCRYVPQVTARGARVILEVQPPLQKLMRTLTDVAQVVAKGAPLPDFDLHCPLVSLPFAFQTRLETIPDETPYLFADKGRSIGWRQRIGNSDEPKVGLVWAGDPRKNLPNANRIDRDRSIEFDRLAPIIETTGCTFYSLQKGEHAVSQLRRSSLRDRVVDWTDELHDFADTAALVDNLDFVITVDTAVAHLAGAIGKPVWLLNRFNTCWRWMLERSDSPWYQNARLFRQDETRDWRKVIEDAADALGDFVRTSRKV